MNKQEFEKQFLLYKKMYDDGNPLITDDEFDAFEDMGKQKFPDSTVFSVVGISDVDDKFSVKLKYPMMSLDKERNIYKLIEWINEEQVVASHKLDGNSCTLIYENGEFKQALSRGNGIYGRDITRAVNYSLFPKNLSHPISGEIRGELIITKDNFVRLNNELEHRGLKKAKNRRNIITGLVKLERKKDFDLAKYITFIAYDVIPYDNSVLFKSEYEKYNYLSNTLYFVTPEYILIENSTELNNIIKDFKDRKNDYEYLCDGLVITINNTKNHTYSDKNPNYKIAYKLENEIVSTTIKNIEINVSGQGRLTYVAILEPVEIDNSTVSRVTIHNYDYIQKHNINVGATIGIVKSGDIIPKHETTIISNGIFEKITKCPVCGSEIVSMQTQDENGEEQVFEYCSNVDCDSRIVGKLNKWIQIIGAKDIGKKTIEKLYSVGLIKKVSDLYRLKLEEISVLEGFGETSAKKIIDTMNSKRNIKSTDIILGTNITNIGHSISDTLLQKYENIPNMCTTMSYDELESLSDIGEVTALTMLRNKQNIMDFYNDIITECNIIQKETTKTSDVFSGKTFVITGTLSKPRDHFKDIIISNGGKVSGSVSKKTSYLLAGVDCGSKLDNAKNLGVEIIDEEKFNNLLDI